MSWLNTFELISFLVAAFAIIYSLKNKDYRTLFAFGSGALFGYTLELFSVNFTGSYYYNPDFWLSVGKEPGQFPVFGGIMWGFAMAYSIKIAHKFNMNRFLASLFAGLLIVGWDVVVDVIAVRIDGGFWTWVGVPIDLSITHSSFLGVSWSNYLGYFFIIPPLAWLTYQSWGKVAENDFRKQFVYMLRNYVLSMVFLILTMLPLGLLNNATQGYSSVILFLTIFIGTLIAVVCHLMRLQLKLSKHQDIGMLVFWMVMYLYTLAAMIHLDLYIQTWWLFAYCILSMIGSLYVVMVEPVKERYSPNSHTETQNR